MPKNYIFKQSIITILSSLVLLSTVSLSEAMPQPSFHTKGIPTGRPVGPLKPGEYWWAPYVSPVGPVLVLISLPQQTLHAYRNGILVGRSSISSGSTGHETPAGMFTILEKKETHRSKKYDNAPMPMMQRLTWSGIAMHSGQLPGYAASHGCIRLPYDFAKLLFSLTRNGGTVVIGDGKTPQPHFAENPGLALAPKDFSPAAVRALARSEYIWQPERSSQGPITILASAADRELYVYRNGVIIGRGAIETKGRLGNHVFTLLEGVSGAESPWAPGRPARKWMRVDTRASGGIMAINDLAKRVRYSPEFAAKIYDAITPGSTVIVTDLPAAPGGTRDYPVFVD